jgi:hypothetical protein
MSRAMGSLPASLPGFRQMRRVRRHLCLGISGYVLGRLRRHRHLRLRLVLILRLLVAGILLQQLLLRRLCRHHLLQLQTLLQLLLQLLLLLLKRAKCALKFAAGVLFRTIAVACGHVESWAPVVGECWEVVVGQERIGHCCHHHGGWLHISGKGKPHLHVVATSRCCHHGLLLHHLLLLVLLVLLVLLQLLQMLLVLQLLMVVVGGSVLRVVPWFGIRRCSPR